MKRIIALLAAILMLVSAFCSCAKQEVKVDDETTAAETTVPALTYEEAKDIVAVTSSTYQITLPIATYFFNSVYQNILSYYSSYLSLLGLDTSKSLKEQAYGDSTWFDYVLDMTKSQMEDVVLFAESAKELGYTLDETDKATIDSFIQSAEDYAAENNATTDEVIASVYGACVNTEVLRECLEIQILADKGFAKFEEDLNYSDEEYEQYYSEHKDDFLNIDYRTYTISVNVGEDVTDDEKATLLAGAKATADGLAAAENEEAFVAALRTYMLGDGGIAEENVESYITATLRKGVSVVGVSELGITVDSYDEVKPGLSAVTEGTNAYTVNYIVSSPSRNEEKLRSVRHILLTVGDDEDSSFKTFDEATVRANEILAEYEAGEKTAEAFGELANKYSEDSGSNESGGLYSDITSDSSYVASFQNWVIDPARKVGETGLVNTDYGVHIMYFNGEEEMSVWKTNARDYLEKQDYDNILEELGTKYGYTVDEEALNKISA